jgi:MFS family permease
VMFFAGGSLASMPPLSLALQGVIAKPSEYAQSNSIFNVFFATGLLLGPLLSGLAFERWGGEKILYLFAALWGAFVLVSWVFRRDDPKHTEHASRAS